MAQPSVNSTAHSEIRASFQAQLAEAREVPGLSRLVRGPTADLYPRYSGYYRQLCRLPRRVRRQLQRQWRRSLSALALLLALGQAPALAATINVNGTTCTLAEAITAANTDAAADGCPAGKGADTIVLPTGSTQSLTSADNSTLGGPTGLPLITSTVTIRGRNSTIQRESAAPQFRILAVASSGDLTLHSTTVSGGRSELPDLHGGGIANYGGTLTLTNSTVSGNSVSYGDGGGVYNSGTLTLTNSTVSGNFVFDGGGGGVSNSGILALTNSTVSGNSAYGQSGSNGGGGGVFNTGALTLTNSTVSGNYGQFGSGVDNHGTLTLTNSTVSGNASECGKCTTNGGGVSNSGTATLTNSTVSGNSSGGFGGSYGGGVFNTGTLTLTNSTVSGNYGQFGGGVDNYGILTLAHTLVSGNTGYSVPEIQNAGSITANNHNLFGHDGDAAVVGFSPGLTDIVPKVPLSAILKPLADNGGPTKTHALPGGSPAVGQSPANSGCKPTDQRGVTRPQGAACDIGAFEKGPPIRCNGRIARILGTVGNDRIIGTPGPDVIHGLAGNDIIDGLEGNDIICGGPGNDKLFGGPGNDKLFGGSGANRLNGGSGTDICKGGPGADKGTGCETEISIP